MQNWLSNWTVRKGECKRSSNAIEGISSKIVLFIIYDGSKRIILHKLFMESEQGFVFNCLLKY